MQDVLFAVEYLIWTRKAVQAANRQWRAIYGDKSSVFMCRVGLHRHLIDWALRTERIPSSNHPMTKMYRLYAEDPEAVQRAARDYYRILRAQRVRSWR